MRSREGQATVEMVAIAPLLIAVAGAIYIGLSAQDAAALADHAAQAGAVAALQDREPKQAAENALPEWAREDAKVFVRDEKITVRVRPRTPVAELSKSLEAEATVFSGEVPK